MVKVIVRKEKCRAAAEDYARGYRKSLKSRGIKTRGRVQVKKVQGGFVAVDMDGKNK